MEKIKFNHDCEKLHQSMGIDEDRKYELEVAVLYNMLLNALMLDKLFDNPDDAPTNMRTKSGMLEKILDYAMDDAELVYLGMEYVIQDKLSDTTEGKLFMSAVLHKLKELDLDEDKFVEWWKETRQKRVKS